MKLARSDKRTWRRAGALVAMEAVLLLALESRSAGAGGFEGIIVMKETAEGEVTTQRLFLKGNKLRLEEAGSGSDGAAIILDGNTRESVVLDPDERAYVPLPWPSETADEPTRAAEDVVVTKAGKRDKVAGRPCEIYLERDKASGGTTEVCVAKGLGNQAVSALGGGDTVLLSSMSSWLRDLIKEGSFPLRGVERDRAGKELSRYEAVTIEAKHLHDALFAPPTDYRRMNMEDVGQGPADRKP